MKTLIYSILSILLITSCTTYSESDLKRFDKEIKSYIKKNKLELSKSNSGLYYKVIEKGDGNFIQLTDTVAFTYTGKLINGTIFDQQKQPIQFKVKDLIACWKEVILANKEGAELFLISPPQLGYGDRKLDDIPENSILIFNLKIEKSF